MKDTWSLKQCLCTNNENSEFLASDPEGLGSESDVPGSVPDVCASIVSLSFSIKAGVICAMSADKRGFGSELFWLLGWRCIVIDKPFVVMIRRSVR